jgi:outer membrane protein assembly factor BamA
MIERNLFVRSGALTNTDHLERTRKNLARIELIKFVSPAALIDTLETSIPTVDYSFYLTRNKKINFDLSGEITYSNINVASQSRSSLSLFGTSFSTSYRDRNIFGKAEVLNVNMELGFDFNFFNKDQAEKPPLLNSLNTGLDGSLTFRRFMDPLNIYQLFGKSNKPDKPQTIARKINTWLREDATSRLGAGFDYVIITDFFEYYNVNANLSYDVRPDPFKKLNIVRIGFDLYVPTAKPAYQKILDQNKFLAESFGNQLYTGLLFRSYLYEINSKDKARTGRFKLLHSFELSGLEMLGINSLVNVINQDTKEIVLNPKGGPDNAVQFSQFARGEIDLRYYYRLSRETTLAAKFNVGVASPYGPFTKQTPYPKQFFVGGALSNRAWQVRQLGPGGYEDTTSIDPNLPYYQTGDFKIDLSVELRFNLFWYFKGVLFMDAANVWILKDDLSRPEANLTSDFINQFGVGYGYGIRLDLDFFIVRLDLGYKLHSPYPVEGSRWLKQRFPKGSVPQIAIGLPF